MSDMAGYEPRPKAREDRPHVLILTVIPSSSDSGAVVTSVEFSTQAAADRAAELWTRQVAQYGHSYKFATVVPKG